MGRFKYAFKQPQVLAFLLRGLPRLIAFSTILTLTSHNPGQSEGVSDPIITPPRVAGSDA